MITYNIDSFNMPVDENGEQVKLTKFPHFNGVNWFEFESDGERQAFIDANTPSPAWSKEVYAEEINNAHNQLFTQLYTEKNYLSIGEIPIWETDEDFSAESLALQDWWRSTCKIVASYLESVTEETAQPIETFINSLPKLDN